MRGVRRRLQKAPPWWVVSLIVGPSCFVLWTVYLKVVAGQSTGAALLGGAFFGLFMGAMLGPVLARINSRFRAAAGPVPFEVQAAASRALWRGPVPKDPVVRRTALRLVEHQQLEAARTSRWSFLVFGAFLMLGLVLAVTESPWHLATAALFAGMLARTVWQPHRLARRARLLRGSPAADRDAAVESSGAVNGWPGRGSAL